MNNVVSAFNLNWKSDDLILPDMFSSKNNKIVDITIKNESYKLWPNITGSLVDTSFLQMTENDLRLEVSNIGKFRAFDGNKISWYKLNPNVDDKDIRTFLMGSIFGAILIQRDLILMHGNALEKNGRTIVCLGFSGSGKSTLAYALIKNGWKLLADDLVALNNEGFILKGIPRLKLWEDTLNSFGIDKENLDSVRNKLNKYFYIPEQSSLAQNKAKLSAIYLVNRFSKKNKEYKQESIEKINDEKIKFLFLRNNLYRPRFVRGLMKEGNIFLKLAYLQKKIPVSFLNLPNKVELLIDWLEELDL